MPGKADVTTVFDAVAEGSVKLLLKRDIEIARSIISKGKNCVYLFIRIFGNEPQHLTRGAAIARIDEIAEASEALTFSNADNGDDAKVR